MTKIINGNRPRANAEKLSVLAFMLILLITTYCTIILHDAEVDKVNDRVEQEYIEHIAIYDDCLSKDNENKISACLQYNGISNYMQYDRDLYLTSVNDYMEGDRRAELSINTSSIWLIILFVGLFGNAFFSAYVVFSVMYAWMKKREIKNIHYCVSCGDKV